RGRRSPRVFDVVVRSLADKNDAVRLAALEAVAHLPAADAAAALRPLAASDDANTDFREAVIRTLAEKLSQPIEIGWLAAIIKSRNVSKPPYVPTPEEERNDPEAALRKVMESVTPVSLGDAPRLMRLYGGTEAVPALLGCLDFENPAVRSYYNAAIITEQLACSGPLAIPWHGDLNRDGTQQETEENRHTLAKLKVWVDYCQTHPGTGAVAPPNPNPAKDQESWGTEVEGLSIRARLNRSVWPAGLPQVATIDACTLPDGKRTSWGTVALSSRAAALEVEINGEWYTLPGDADQSVCGEWNAYHGNRWQDLQLDGRWRRRSDGQALDLKPGKYTVRVALSRLPTGERTGLATSEPTSFEVIATE
ncbi:MAG TPA: hypothetical protein VMF30_11220, partial [Pirellulales bacterium]|nr:hypothetical protein [Pirellulales bacterium]